MFSDVIARKVPRTQAVRRALQTAGSELAAKDLLFLEEWEIEPNGNLGVALRVSQIRRANPGLAAEISRELKQRS